MNTIVLTALKSQQNLVKDTFNKYNYSIKIFCADPDLLIICEKLFNNNFHWELSEDETQPSDMLGITGIILSFETPGDRALFQLTITDYLNNIKNYTFIRPRSLNG